MEPFQNQTQPIINNIPAQPTNLPTQQPVANIPTGSANNLGSGNSHKKVGPIVATLVVILVIIIAAIYIFASKVNKQPLPNDNQTVGTVQNSQPIAPQTNQPVSASTDSVAPINNSADDLQSLQNDLNNSTVGVDAQNI